jgi:outer membrane protein TolC
MSRFWLCVMALGAGVAWGASPSLTLEAVLATAETPHPDLDLARARLEAAQAEIQAATSLNDFRVTLDASLRGGRNDLYQDRYQPDHFLRLKDRKSVV